MELRVSRSREKCSVCGSKLPPRTEAWFDEDRGTATCVSCERLNRPDPLPVHQIRGEPLPTPPAPRSASTPASLAEPATDRTAERSPERERPRIRSASRSRSSTVAEPLRPEMVSAASQPPAAGPCGETTPGVETSVEAAPAVDVDAEAVAQVEDDVEGGTRHRSGSAAPGATAPGTGTGPGVAADTGVDPGREDEARVGTDTDAPVAAHPGPVHPGPEQPEDPTRPGPLVAELPFADGGAPLSWKGDLFQGPPTSVPTRFDPEQAPVSVRFASVVAGLALDRAEPEDRIGTVLRDAESRGLIWLPGRRTSGGYVIDHLVATPNGIWVVVAEPDPTGRVEKRDVGDWFTPEPRLYVGDDDHTRTIRRAEAVDDSLGRALRGTIAADVPRYKVVSFVDSPPGWLDRPFPFGDVWVTWSHHLVEPMLSTVEYQRDEVAELAEVLDEVLATDR